MGATLKEIQDVLKAVTVLYMDNLTKINPKINETNGHLLDLRRLIANFVATLAINYYGKKSESDIPKEISLFIRSLVIGAEGYYDSGVNSIAPDDSYFDMIMIDLNKFFKNADDLRKFNCSSQALNFLENSISIYNDNMVADFFKDLDKNEINKIVFNECNQKFSHTISHINHINVDNRYVELSDVEPSILVDFLRNNPEMELMEIMQPNISRVLGNIFSKNKDQDLQMEF